MEIYTGLMEFFEITTLGSSATFIDLLNNLISIFFAIFIVSFLIRTLLLACSVPFDNWD